MNSLDYLKDIVSITGDKESAIEVLELVGYILTDNDNAEARYLIDDLIEELEK